MLKDDLQACWVSGYSFIGSSKFDQVDGYFGPGAIKCPDGSEYVWQRGVESLQGRVTAARS